jgi:hypothetical protein
MSLIKQIGIGNVLNSILVNENVRPSMLVQPADYNEATGKDPRTKSIIEAIKTQFPELQFSEDYKTNQGVIISKKNYNGRKDISLERMGEILGYPCYQDFNNIDPETVSYSINIYVKQKNSKITQLFANICKDDTNIEKFKSFANKAKIALDKEDYKDILDGFEIDTVDVEIKKIVPTQLIIRHLIENKTLEQDEIDKIQNILFNFGFSMELQFYFLDNFQYANPIHKGILLDLLVKEKNDTLSPFYPLHNYTAQQNEIDEITKAWEKDTLYILEKTKLPVNQIGKGNKKTKRKQQTIIKEKTRKNIYKTRGRLL